MLGTAASNSTATPMGLFSRGGQSSVRNKAIPKPVGTAINMAMSEVTTVPSRPVTRDEYVDRILTGGFPMILQRLTTRARTSWFADYVNLVVMRDVLDIARVRQREALPRLLRQFAAQTGQMLNISKAGQAVGLESSTANRYATLLEAAFMIQRLPAWGTTLGKRITAYPKVHVIDSGLAGWLLGLSAAKISSRDPAVLTEFGHLVETFAVGEILKQVSWSDEAVTAAYFRTQSGDEVDLVLETWDGRVAGFEVKAGSRVQDTDLSGLRLLRDRLGERFIAGFLLNLGELAYRKEERIMVMPLSGLWSLASKPSSAQRSARSMSLSRALENAFIRELDIDQAKRSSDNVLGTSCC